MNSNAYRPVTTYSGQVSLRLIECPRAGSRVVLGLFEGAAVPPEQAVAWPTLRPGSGRLEVALAADGPTRTVRIYDREAPAAGRLQGGDGPAAEAEAADAARRREWGVRLAWAGLGVSLVGRAPPAELVHARFAHLQLELAAGPRAARLTLVVQQMQWDNQLLGTPSPVLLYCLPDRAGPGAPPLPALHAAAELMRAPARRYNAHFFRHLIVALRPLAVRLEERCVRAAPPRASRAGLVGPTGPTGLTGPFPQADPEAVRVGVAERGGGRPRAARRGGVRGAPRPRRAHLAQRHPLLLCARQGHSQPGTVPAAVSPPHHSTVEKRIKMIIDRIKRKKLRITIAAFFA